MITLEEIKEFAVKKQACSGEVYPFCEYIRNGDEKSAWQTVLGNIGWLTTNGLKLEVDIPDILKLADHTGRDHYYINHQIDNIWKYDENGLMIYNESYHSNGNLCFTANYKNDEYHGLHTSYSYTGIKYMETNYENDVENGTRTYFNEDGVITERYKYVDGECICELLPGE